MAKFLNTRKAVSEIDDLIRNAGQTLILISPYLKLAKDFRDLLTYRNSKDKVTIIIFREQALKIDELKFLEELRLVKLKSNESLHAKCYVNDEKMVITSLNLYEFSMANNKEMGVLIEKSNPHDKELFDDASKKLITSRKQAPHLITARNLNQQKKFQSQRQTLVHLQRQTSAGNFSLRQLYQKRLVSQAKI